MTRGGGGHSTRAAGRVARNVFYLAVAEGASKVMMFVFFVIAARHLGSEKFGVFSFALAYVSMFAVTTDLGLGVLTAREIARDRSIARRLVGSSLGIKVVASVIAIAAAAVVVHLLRYPWATIRVVYVCSVFILTSAAALYYTFVFQGFERMEFTAATRVLQTVILVVGALLLVRGEAAVEHYALLYIAAGLAAALFAGGVASMRFVRFGISFAGREWKKTLGKSLPFGSVIVFAAFYYWTGSTFLSKMCGDGAVGTYSVAFRLVMGLGFVSAAYAGAVYPAMSRLFVTDRQRLARVVERSLMHMLLLAVPLGLVGMVLARPGIALLYGPKYADSVVALRILVWWGGFLCMNSVLSHYFYSIDRPRVAAIQAGMALAVCLVLNFTLIPRLGPVGAAASILAAEALSFGFLLVLHLRTPCRSRTTMLLKTFTRALVASVPAAAVALVVQRWDNLASLVAGVLMYIVMIVLLGGLGRSDLEVIRTLVRREHG